MKVILPGGTALVPRLILAFCSKTRDVWALVPPVTFSSSHSLFSRVPFSFPLLFSSSCFDGRDDSTHFSPDKQIDRQSRKSSGRRLFLLLLLLLMQTEKARAFTHSLSHNRRSFAPHLSHPPPLLLRVQTDQLRNSKHMDRLSIFLALRIASSGEERVSHTRSPPPHAAAAVHFLPAPQTVSIVISLFRE